MVFTAGDLYWHESEFTLPEDLAAGEYDLRFALTDLRTGEPWLKLPIANRDEEGRHFLDRIRVKTRTKTEERPDCPEIGGENGLTVLQGREQKRRSLCRGRRPAVHRRCAGKRIPAGAGRLSGAVYLSDGDPGGGDPDHQWGAVRSGTAGSDGKSGGTDPLARCFQRAGGTHLLFHRGGRGLQAGVELTGCVPHLLERRDDPAAFRKLDERGFSKREQSDCIAKR